PKLMVPGQIYRVELSGIVTGNDFLPGHQLRIEIAGSNFPLFERNLQTGGKNYDETAPQSATIKVYHDREHASYVEVTVVGKSAAKSARRDFVHAGVTSDKSFKSGVRAGSSGLKEMPKLPKIAESENQEFSAS